MSQHRTPSSEPKAPADERSQDETLHPHEELPKGKDFGADDDTPQQGGM